MSRETNDFLFGRKQISTVIHRTGDFSIICVSCGKPHRAYMTPEHYFNGDTCECDKCCPVVHYTISIANKSLYNE